MRKELTEFCYYLERKEKINLKNVEKLVDDFMKIICLTELLNHQTSIGSYYKSICNSQNLLEQLISSSIEVGIKNYAISIGEEKEYLSQSAAYRKYGRKTIDRWKHEGKISAVKQNGIIKYKVSTLEKLSLANELFNKFIVID